MLCTIFLQDCKISNTLLDVKRRLVLDGDIERTKLHASEDSLPIRDEVFSIISQHDMVIDCTVLEKAKAQPQTRVDEPTFYKYAWYYHFKHVGPRLCRPGEKTLITAAALGDKKKRAAFKGCVNNVAQQIVSREQWEVSFIESSQDPCLWLVDYCAWAIQRKWEMGDTKYYNAIQKKIATEYDLWRMGTKHYY